MRATTAHSPRADPVLVRRRMTDEPELGVLLRYNDFRRPASTATTASPGQLNPRGVLALQRAVGNLAIGELLSRSRASHPMVQRDDDAPTVSGPLGRGIRLLPAPVWLAEPGNFLRDKPSLIPPGGLTLLPPAGVESLIDWGEIGTAYRGRQLVLEDRDRALIIGHWQRWYPVAQGLYKLPLAKSLFGSPAAIMNTMSAKMIDSTLAGDRPNMEEMFNQRAEQFGVKTTTVSVTVGHF